MSAPLNLNATHQAREWHHREHSRAERVEILRNDWSVVICKRKCDIVDDCPMPKYNSSEKDQRGSRYIRGEVVCFAQRFICMYPIYKGRRLNVKFDVYGAINLDVKYINKHQALFRKRIKTTIDCCLVSLHQLLSLLCLYLLPLQNTVTNVYNCSLSMCFAKC